MLERGNLPINLNAPMDTKVDEKLTNQEIFILHQNARFRKIGSIIKRNGYEKIELDPADISTYSLSLKRAWTENNNVLVVPQVGAKGIAAFRDANNTFLFNSVRVPCELKGRIVASLQEGIVGVDSDFMDNFRVMVYFRFTTSATNNDLIVNLMDESTGAQKTLLVDNTTRRDAVVRFFRNASNQPRICVAYDDSSAANTGRAKVYDLNLVELNNRSFTMTQTTSGIAAEVYGNNVVVACKAAANTVRFCIVPETAALTQWTFTTGVNIKTLATMDIRISGDICYCAYITDSATAAARFFSIDLTDGSTVNADRIIVNPSVDLTHVTFDFITSDIIGFYASVGVTSLPYDPELYFSEHTISTSTTATGINKRGYTCISRCKTLNLNNATDRVVVVNATDASMRVFTLNSPTNLGTMYFLATRLSTNTEPDIIAAYNAETVPYNCVSETRVNTNLYFQSAGILACLTTRTTALFAGTPLFEVASAHLAQFDFRDSFYQKNYTTKFAQNMYVSSGYLLEYDGLTLAKSGFFHSPSIIDPATIVAGAGIAAGTYNFRIVFEYTDARGQRYQSAPSNSYQVVLGAAAGSIILNYIRPVSYRPDSSVVIYMTTNGGSIFYRVTFYPIGTTAAQVLAVPTGSEETIYTTGGVLPNDPAPPMSFICTHQERLYGIVSDFENEIAYSKRSALGGSAEFSDFQRIYLAASGVKSKNELTGLASMNEKLIIFRRSSIYYILGDGPNILGEQNNFTEPELIANDIGCIQPKSIVSSPKGVFFKSEKGIYLLDPSLNVSYIGSPVEQYNSEEVIGHLIDEEENLVQFLTTSRIIAYDYVLERWSIDTVAALDLGAYNKKNVIIQSDNTFLLEDSSYKDFVAGVETGITLLVETGWIKASGIQDFGRFVNGLVLGKYKSAHTLRVDVYYDYNTNIVTTFDLTHDPAQQVYQFRVHLKYQKAQAIKFRIYDVPSNFGESCELTNLTLELGIKKGVYKTPKTRNY